VIRHEAFRYPFERLMAMAASGTRSPLAMPMDVYRSKDSSYHIEADLPGMDADSVDVTLEENTLTIRAERKPNYRETDHVLAAERPQGPFTRQLTLGEGLDADHLAAAYADGVFHVTIPASPKVQPRRIKVNHGAGKQPTAAGIRS
jgi:HSP20 family protein